MTFEWIVSVGDIIAFLAFLGSIFMFVMTSIKQRDTKESAKRADSFNESAKKYYDLMVEEMKGKKENTCDNQNKSSKNKAYCDANIVRIGNNKWILKVFNKGNANAIEVSFKYMIDNAPEIISVHGTPFPIKLLEPQKNVDYHLGIDLGLTSASWEYEIAWKNEDGTEDSKKGILTLPLT